MSARKQSTIEVDIQDWHLSKSFLGTDAETYNEANDWMNAVLLQYISANNIPNEEVDYILNSASHTIIWENSSFICMYAVCRSADSPDEPIIGIYPTLAEAEESIFTECQDWTEEFLNSEDPMDAFGKPNFSFPSDYWFLMNDCASAYSIQVVPAFGVEEPLE